MGPDDQGDTPENGEPYRNQNQMSEISDPRPGNLSTNAVLDVLAHHHRREILKVLINSDTNTVEFDEIIPQICSRETSRVGSYPSRNQISTEFHHVHLPKLTDAGVVEYDSRTKELRYWEHEGIEKTLEHVQSL